MKRKRYSEEKIISILKEHEAGATVADISRRHGISENTIHRWKSKFGGMEVSEAKRLREPIGFHGSTCCPGAQAESQSDTLPWRVRAKQQAPSPGDAVETR